ncbi:MAG: Histidine--tRNA ligase [Alphaproteobacteria bacterium MarineAlpha9_Bin3]|nr:MAG: Histidine--tRNA ligase [Alphaproteobacteria bacterium MarineAlpha9_Bin3]|tara:strand:- start:7579 stop:8829 length:1251 start_codon:yes stop_codon:yes gene_type:complete
MNNKLQSVRGTHDHLHKDMYNYNYIVNKVCAISANYGFKQMSTPIFEFSNVFKRTLGESSDIVTKEMYTFKDKGDEEITLRPEGTAGIIRAIISNGLTQEMPFKAFYHGPMFRYERPQKGRLRQFHQVGVELLGVKKEQADIEVIACAKQVLDELNIEKYSELNINSLGSIDDRQEYIKALTNYLSDYKNKLSKDSLTRLDKNPLRILDSKSQDDISIIKNAPKLSEYLNNSSLEGFKNILEGLDNLNIKYIINDKLVRGLDYYNDTTFEFITDKLGSQSAIIAGGRYDGLMKQMGGTDIPGIGWAGGIERLILLSTINEIKIKHISIIPVGEENNNICINLAHKLRNKNISCEMSYSGNLKKRLKNANKLTSNYAIIIGTEEINNNYALVRNLESGEQEKIKLPEIIKYIEKKLL